MFNELLVEGSLVLVFNDLLVFMHNFGINDNIKERKKCLLVKYSIEPYT
jgi:hypothetical protein